MTLWLDDGDVRLYHGVKDLTEALTTLTEDGCLLWRGPLSSEGYAVCRCDGERHYVHRLIVGTGADGMDVHHMCGNRSCVNGAHLKVVTRQQHSALHRATRCRHGHFYTDDNTYITPSGSRQCRICKRKSTRAYLKRRRGGDDLGTGERRTPE